MGTSTLSVERTYAPLETDRCFQLNAGERAEAIWKEKGRPPAGPEEFVAVARQIP